MDPFPAVQTCRLGTRQRWETEAGRDGVVALRTDWAVVSALSMFYGLHCVAMLCAQTCTGYRTGPNSESCMALNRRVSVARRWITCFCLSAVKFPLHFFLFAIRLRSLCFVCFRQLYRKTRPLRHSGSRLECREDTVVFVALLSLLFEHLDESPLVPRGSNWRLCVHTMTTKLLCECCERVSPLLRGLTRLSVALLLQVIKVYNEDNSSRAVEVPGDITARDVCQLFVLKNQCVDDHNWTLFEHLPHLGIGKTFVSPKTKELCNFLLIPFFFLG